jgi:hypothetical protein
MRRREFIGVLASAAILSSRGCAPQTERMRRIGVLMPAASDDAVFQACVGAFLQGLALFGWNIGSNVRIDTTSSAAESQTRGRGRARVRPRLWARC